MCRLDSWSTVSCWSSAQPITCVYVIKDYLFRRTVKTLREYNKEIYSREYSVSLFGEPVLNGILCDVCNSELYDTKPNMILASLPPKKFVHCKSCGFDGYRVV